MELTPREQKLLFNMFRKELKQLNDIEDDLAMRGATLSTRDDINDMIDEVVELRGKLLETPTLRLISEGDF